MRAGAHISLAGPSNLTIPGNGLLYTLSCVLKAIISEKHKASEAEKF